MSYIGRDLNNLSDRAKLDSISTSATATFNLLLNSVAYVPSSAESLTVSLNGVIQAPQSSYTVSGSTIVFASNLASSDVIDFILAERAITLSTIGSGTVTTSNIVDANVTTAKIADNAVTSAKLASGLALGKIGQVVSSANSQTNVQNTSTTYADIGLSASITPSATSSKIYVTVVVSMLGETGSETNVTTQHRILRGSTQIIQFNTARINGVESAIGGSPSLAILDSPSTTSAVTYSVQQKVEVAGGRSVTSSWNSGASTITLMEVLA